MWHNRKDLNQEMISIEEYLKRRQAIRAKEGKPLKGDIGMAEEWGAAMELAALMER